MATMYMFPKGAGELWQKMINDHKENVGEGIVRRYFHEAGEGAEESLLLHMRSPLERCDCHACRGGKKLAFRWDGANMRETPHAHNSKLIANPIVENLGIKMPARKNGGARKKSSAIT